jgi:diguanylate cyclase (GGDEF)-like protein
MEIQANIDELIKLVSTATEAFTTAFFLADNLKRELKLWHFYSLSENVISNASIDFGEGPIGWVAENMKPYDISKFSDRDSGMLGLYSKNEEIKSFFAVPVIRERLLEGVLCIDSKKTFVFANREQKLLIMFSDQFASLVNNMRIKRFVDTESSDVAAIQKLSREIASAESLESIMRLTLDSVIRLVECNSCFVSLKIDDEEDIFRVEAANSHRNVEGMTFTSQDGLAGYVIRNKEPFLLTNRREELGSYVFGHPKLLRRVKSFLGIPMLDKNGVLGLICLIDDKENAFNQRDLMVINILANNAYLAIKNTRDREKIHRMSTVVDGLTGLYSFSGFQTLLETAFQEATPRRRPLSLIIIDFDKFRKLNDLLGYEIGNEVLKRFSRILLEICKDHDNAIQAARFGSDEFAIILPNVPSEQAISIAQRIREEVMDTKFVSSNYAVSVSIGIASFSYDNKSCGDLIDNALHAISLAQSQGGNRAVYYDPRNT